MEPACTASLVSPSSLALTTFGAPLRMTEREGPRTTATSPFHGFWFPVPIPVSPWGNFSGNGRKGEQRGFCSRTGFFSPFPGFRPTRNQTQFPGGFQPRFRIPVSNPGSDPDRADPGFGSPFAGNPEVPKTRRGVGENNL